MISLFSANWVESPVIQFMKDPGSWFLQLLIPDPLMCYFQSKSETPLLPET